MSTTVTKEIIQEDIQEILDLLTGTPCKLIVHNDEVNTFDWVIQSLVDICKYSMQQAEQAAHIIHFKGKYVVKEGVETVLKPMREALVDRGIGATLEYD